MTRNASLARRIASLGYEALLVGAVVLIAGFAVAPLVTPAAADHAELRVPDLAQRVMLFSATFSVVAVSLNMSWRRGRRTLAMKTWRLAIVDVDGRPIDTKRALARYLAGWVGPALAVVAYVALRPYRLGGHAAWLVALNFVWAAIDPDRQFLHDRIARTRIVDEG